MSTTDERIAEWEAEHAARRADNDALRAQVPRLLGRVEEVEARRAKESHHSSTPPASDPLGRKRPRSQRPRSGKKPGGQLGHPGETLHLVGMPDEVARAPAGRLHDLPGAPGRDGPRRGLGAASRARAAPAASAGA